jgi:hypothetical protein
MMTATSNNQPPQPQSPLSHLLARTQPLHQSTLSLSQLVPVHWSLLQVSSETIVEKQQIRTRKNEDADSITSSSSCCSSSWESVLNGLTHTDEATAMNEILFGDAATTCSSPAQKLLVIQYLLFQTTSSFDSVLSALSRVVLPLLRQQQQYESLIQDKKEMDTMDVHSQEGSLFEESLMEAILDAVLIHGTTKTSSSANSNKDDDHDDVMLSVFLERFAEFATQVLQQSSIATFCSWKATCRILTRVVESFSEDCRPDILVTALSDLVQQGIAVAIQKLPMDRLSSLLPPITNDLLPLLLLSATTSHQSSSLSSSSSPAKNNDNHCGARCVIELWDHVVMNIYKQQRDQPILQQHASVYLVVTSVLCTILPWRINNTNDHHHHHHHHQQQQSSPTPPLTQTVLWDLIYFCVSQNLEAPKRLSWVEESWSKESATAAAAASSSSSSNGRLQADLGTLQLLRRRGLYLLRILVEHEPELSVWNKYVACYETLEMESTSHLIDQTWDTIADIASTITVESERALENPAALVTAPPCFSWQWLKVMLTRVLTSRDAPTIRKLSLFRLFTGQAGICLEPQATGTSTRANGQAEKSKKSKSRPLKTSSAGRGAPLAVVTPDFVFEAVILSFDTLEAAVGTNIHLDDDKKEARQDVSELFTKFLCSYVHALQNNAAKCHEFFLGLWGQDVLCRINRKTAVLIFTSIAELLSNNNSISLSMSEDGLATLSQSLHSIFAMGSVILSYQKTMLESFAIILAHANAMDNLKPLTILGVLDLFPVPDTPSDAKPMSNETNEDDLTLLNHHKSFRYLQMWLKKMKANDLSWAANFGSAVSAAYVDGMLTADAAAHTSHWDPLVGLTTAAKDMGKAVVFFCSLATVSENAPGKTPSELLWPAIYKGVSHAPRTTLDPMWTNAEKVARALVLIEYGCKIRVISGMGNGDLVVDRKTNGMMPPSQHVEFILKQSTDFIFHSIRALLPSGNIEYNPFTGSNARSPIVRQATTCFAKWTSLLQIIHEGFPSSLAIEATVDSLLKENVHCLVATNDNHEIALRMSTIFASLSCGGELDESQLAHICNTLLSLDHVSEGRSAVEEQTSRSIFQGAKWGSMAILVVRLIRLSDQGGKMDTVERILDHVEDAIHLVPLNAILPLFNCVAVAADYAWASSSLNFDRLAKTIQSLTILANEMKNSNENTAMFDEVCRLIFRPELLLAESKRLSDVPDCATPVRDAFREFIKLAGVQRTHVAAAVLCRMVYGWLGPEDKRNEAGIAAIPYKEDIVALLLFKEARVEEASVNQTYDSRKYSGLLPFGTDDRSISRGFVIAFLSRLPDIEQGLSPAVLTGLCHFLIDRLLSDIELPDKAQLMLGTPAYCRCMRGWQGLCVISRFMTASIAEDICNRVMEAFGGQLFGQIRYFIEVFTIQCTRRFPDVFGKALLREIRRTNLSLQHISSLCIVVGALICGPYKIKFFTDKNNVGQALAGVLPWLGSTQGFARAIAQLLVHKLIPLAIDVSAHYDRDTQGTKDWVLLSIYDFLENHDEMKRLRKKQTKFFESYDADTACTLDGILQVVVDEGGEAMPKHLVGVMKETLREVFAEGNSHDTPEWKHLENLLSTEHSCLDTDVTKNGSVNFQRKIIPLDALNLALEHIQDRQQRNRAGRKKQPLIVCATLVDKVPNLGGLARTAEIFAAERLVIPDLRVTQMDNFKSLSVTAGDWIEIEECKETVRR